MSGENANVAGEEQAVEEDDEEDIYSGRLEAIKLTGDPNVPRGEYTFIAEDIGRRGLIRVAEEPTFRGARVVKSVGHIAGRFFRDGKPVLRLPSGRTSSVLELIALYYRQIYPLTIDHDQP